MRILIGWADDFSPNLGVRALGQGSIDLLQRVWPAAEVVTMNYGNRPAQLPWGRLRSLARERVTGKLGMMDWLSQFDLLWDTRSGDSFADIYGLQRHYTMSAVAELAVSAGVRLAIAPQTIGPFNTRRGRWVARHGLRRADLVFSREPFSSAAAARLGRPVDATGSDLAFGINQPVPGTPRDVLLNVSGLLWSGSKHVDSASYREQTFALIDGLLAAGREVTLLPHVINSPDADNDEPVSHELAKRYEGRLDVFVPGGLGEARSAIAASKLVIGARMHACLNALSTGTPAIALAYSRKFAPLMDSIGWRHVIDVASTPDIAERALAAANSASLSDDALEARDRGRALLDPVVDRVGA